MIRHLIRLIEAVEDWDEEDAEAADDEDEDDETHYDHLPTSTVLQSLRPRLIQVAQKVYDWWDQGEHDELNGGGICHLIADKMADVIGNANVPVSTVSASDEFHVYCVAQCQDGVFEIDLPYHLYERGGGFTWTKLPDVIFTPEDIRIYQLDRNPGSMKDYVEEWGD